MSVKTIDKDVCRMLRHRITDALSSLGKELGLVIEAKNASFTPNCVTFKVECATLNENGSVNDKFAESFKRNAFSYGFKPEDLGRTFNRAGHTYRIVGANPRSYRYPILVERVGDKMSFKYDVALVKLLLGSAVDLTFSK